MLPQLTIHCPREAASTSARTSTTASNGAWSAENAGRLLERCARTPASAHAQPPRKGEQQPVETAIFAAVARGEERRRERSL